MTKIPNIFSNKVKSSALLKRKKNQFHIKNVFYPIRMIKGFGAFRLEFPVNDICLLIQDLLALSEFLKR